MIANQSHRSEWNEIYTMQTSYKYQKLIQCLRLLMKGQVQVGRKSASCKNCECRSKVSVYSKTGSAHSSHGLLMLQTVYVACRWTCCDSVDHSISRWWLFTKVQL